MNCKPGDLAYIRDGANVGAVIEVDSFCEVWSDIEGVPFWNISSKSPLLCYDFCNRDCWLTEMVIADSRLRPISGVPITEEVTDEVTP